MKTCKFTRLLATAMLACAALFILSGRAEAGKTVYSLYNDGFDWDSYWNPDYCGVSGNMYTSTTGATASTTYQDTVEPGIPITSITMDVGGFMFCNGASLQVKLNGTSLATINTPATCLCTSAGNTTTGISVSAANYGTRGQQKTVSILNGTGGNGIISALWTTTLAANHTDPLIKITVNYASNTITSPQQATFIGTTTPSITWTDDFGGTAFNLQISTDPFFQTPFLNKALGDVQTYKLTGSGAEVLEDGRSYYARVRASAGGTNLNFSPIVDFGVMITPPEAPNLLTPGADLPNPPSIVNTTTPTFNWSMVTTPQ